MSEKPTRRNEKIVHDPKSSPAAEKPQIVFNQKNEFYREMLPDPVRLAQIRDSAPEVYAAYVKQIELNAEHNREMQRRSIAIDEAVVPQLPKNDRLGILVGGAVAMSVIALSMLAVWKGQPYGWAVGILAALPLLITSLRSLRAPKDEGQDDGGEEE